MYAEDREERMRLGMRVNSEGHAGHELLYLSAVKLRGECAKTDRQQ